MSSDKRTLSVNGTLVPVDSSFFEQYPSSVVSRTTDSVTLDDLSPSDVDVLKRFDETNPPIDYPSLKSLLVASSREKGLDIPKIFEVAKASLEKMFPPIPVDLPSEDTKHHLEDALELADRFQLDSIRKSILYTLSTSAHSSTLPAHTLKTTTYLHEQLIAHFTPTLFTVPTSSHMPCTDAFADTWMDVIIGPAISGDDEGVGVDKPLQTLERMRRTDWVKMGVCEGCVEDKRSEWSEEQERVWERLDGWIQFGARK